MHIRKGFTDVLFNHNSKEVVM